MFLRSLVSTAALALVLGGPAAAFTLPPNLTAPPPLLLAQAEDVAARLQAAEEEFEAATQELQEALTSGGDVEAARQRLEAAQEELRAAQQAAAEEPPADTEQAEPEQPPADTQEAAPEQPPAETQEAEPELPPAETQEAEPVQPPAETQEAEPVQPPAETEQAEPELPPAETDQAEPEQPTLETQEAEPVQPPAETQEAAPEPPAPETQEAEPAEPPAETEQAEPELPPAETQEAEPAEPPAETEQAEPSEPAVEEPAPETGQAAPEQPEAGEQQAEPRRERRPRQAAPDEPRTLEQQAEPRDERRRRGDRKRRAEDLPQQVPEDAEVVRREGDRIIIQLGDQFIVRKDENDRMRRFGREVETERLRGGLTRTIISRPNGVQVITVRNEYGEIVRRVRRLPDGREIVLVDVREPERPPRVDWEMRLPPLVVQIPRDEYIVEMDRASEQEIHEALTAPPVEEVERVYTLQEVRQSERLRDKVRRIDLDTITFEFNSAEIARDQIPALARIGEALEDVLAEDPEEVYLIEGHTDAVGSDLYNLALSDRRAESVAIALSQNFEVPPENLITQGYGEQYLKVPTEAPERQNRRVTIRRITPLISSAR